MEEFPPPPCTRPIAVIVPSTAPSNPAVVGAAVLAAVFAAAAVVVTAASVATATAVPSAAADVSPEILVTVIAWDSPSLVGYPAREQEEGLQLSIPSSRPLTTTEAIGGLARLLFPRCFLWRHWLRLRLRRRVVTEACLLKLLRGATGPPVRSTDFYNEVGPATSQ